ncbi:MAG TPA: DUF4126 domain-containing protein [Candidatus Baltobacteraceae bacterium]|jgi:hypothetical protein|nr:DUF4126 domain-containing protein [Candidatus Baltobacteraceae bacterium]
MDAAAQYALAYALTTSAGLRAVLPLALGSLAAHFGYIHPPHPYEWLGSGGAMVVLVAIAVAEMLADKVPVLDHVLHFVQIVSKPAAAAILVGGSVHPQSHAVLVGLMFVGALNALGVHAVTSTVRIGSTATTAGIANPFISIAEDFAAVATAILAFFAPFLAAALAFAVVLFIVLALRTAYRRVRT